MNQETMNQKQICWDFPGGPVVKISPFSAEDVSLIPGRAAKTSHASWPETKT